MARGRPENPMIAALEHTAAAAGVLLGAFTVVMARQRINMTPADWDEYEEAIKARDRIVAYLQQIRAQVREP